MITGASTGIGRATAILFQERGWNVVATMRTPDSRLRSPRSTTSSSRAWT